MLMRGFVDQYAQISTIGNIMKNKHMIGCFVESIDGGKTWRISWPDNTLVEAGFKTQREAEEALFYYITES